MKAGCQSLQLSRPSTKPTAPKNPHSRVRTRVKPQIGPFPMQLHEAYPAENVHSALARVHVPQKVALLPLMVALLLQIVDASARSSGQLKQQETMGGMLN